jgi:hypothetical protein
VSALCALSSHKILRKPPNQTFYVRDDVLEKIFFFIGRMMCGGRGRIRVARY